jgi:hypothetical protein
MKSSQIYHIPGIASNAVLPAFGGQEADFGVNKLSLVPPDTILISFDSGTK